MKKIKAQTKHTQQQAELKRLRIDQEIQREQEEIEVKIKELEARGVLIEKALRGEGEELTAQDPSYSKEANEKRHFKELPELWRNITQLE